MSVHKVLDVSSAAPHERFTVWRDLMCLTYCPVLVYREPAEFHRGTILKTTLGDVHVSLIDADPHSVARTEELITRTGCEWIHIYCPLQGKVHVTQDGRQAVVRADELISLDSTRPYTLSMPEPFRMVTLKFPHQMIGLAAGETQTLTATPWSGTHGVGGLLSRLMALLSQHLDDLSTPIAYPLGSSLGSLVTTLFTELPIHTPDDPDTTRHTLLHRILGFARENLADSGLDPVVLARQHNISVRYLQVLFQEFGTSPARWIRDQRLTRCHQDLRNPRLEHKTVAAIGERWGFLEASHFGRLFRERYGVTPREFRKKSQSTDPAAKQALSEERTV